MGHIKIRFASVVTFIHVIQTFTEIESVSLVDFKTNEFISHYGYIPEIHNVITDDGYNLTIFRCNAKSSPSNGKRVVVIQHGVVCSSDDFTMNLPQQSLAYVMADAGYDVWLPNHRGNIYSRKNLYKNPDNPADDFWDFAFDDIGLKDYPPTFDYIRKITKQPKLFVISYSQATSSMLALLAEKPEFNDQIYAMSMMAPIAYLDNAQILLREAMMLTAQTLRHREVFRRTKLFVRFCKSPSGVALMNRLSDQFFGKSIDERNDTMLPIIAGHTPAGTSTIQFTHYIKMANLGFFGPKIKGAINESDVPPDFPLHKISTPTSIHYSKNDKMSNPIDVEKLITKLNGTKNLHIQKIDSGEFNHLDFQWGRNAAKIVYSDIIKFFAQNFV